MPQIQKYSGEETDGYKKQDQYTNGWWLKEERRLRELEEEEIWGKRQQRKWKPEVIKLKWTGLKAGGLAIDTQRKIYFALHSY